MLILNACDEKYWKHARSLLGSIAANTRHGVNFKLLQPPAASPWMNQIGKEEWRADYCANYRVWMMAEALKEQKSVLWLDSDTVVRGSLAFLENLMENGIADVLAVKTPEFSEEQNQWLISTVGVAKTAGGMKFMAEWCSQHEAIVYSPGYEPSIMTCQIAFVRAVAKLEKQVAIKDIGYEWSDKFMREASPIWEAQGNRKDDVKFVTEQGKYL